MRASSPKSTKLGELYADLAKEAYKPFEVDRRQGEVVRFSRTLRGFRLRQQPGCAAQPGFFVFAPVCRITNAEKSSHARSAAILSATTEGLKICRSSTYIALSGEDLAKGQEHW